MSKKNLKFSIITPSYNQAKYIEKTIKSVLQQNYKNFEHIIMDAESNDSTVEILKKYPHLKWISEKDEGQANAINKGFAKADGDIFAWINSDDFYDKNAFAIVAEHFNNNPDSKFVYGDITYVDKKGSVVKINSGKNLSYEKLLINPDIIRQPSCFWRRELFEECGSLDENLYLVMDLDLFLRFGRKTDLHYINQNLSFYRVYSETKTLSNQKKQISEILKVVKKYNGSIPIQLLIHFAKRYLRAKKEKLKSGR